MKVPDWERIAELVGRTPAELLAQRRRLFTVSNGISLLRVIGLPFLLYAISLPPEKGAIPIIVLSLAISATDMLDGFVARRMNQVSELGKVIDPVADKICLGFSSVWLYLYRDLPLWIPALIVGRDVLIIAGSVLLARRVDIVLPSNQLGRATTIVLTATLFVYAIDWTWPQAVLVRVSGAFIVVSFLAYVRISWHILRRL